MASEILAVPEDHLAGVIDVIRAGLDTCEDITPEVEEQLYKWCDKEEAYLKRLRKPD